MGKITTHVLDTSQGKPGRGIEVTLYRLEGAERVLVTRATTNQDGRCDAPLAEGEKLRAAVYELDFEVGRYFAHQSQETQTNPTKIPFLDRVTLRFGVNDAAAHYHVPLLVTPWSYATYRGS